jgi:hypothetical protein
MTAAMRSPGSKPWAAAKSSLTATSVIAPGAGRRPRRRKGTLRRGAPNSGRDRILPVIGSSKPSTSRFTGATTRVSTWFTPGSSVNCSATDSGARTRLANTWAKRWST